MSTFRRRLDTLNVAESRFGHVSGAVRTSSCHRGTVRRTSTLTGAVRVLLARARRVLRVQVVWCL